MIEQWKTVVHDPRYMVSSLGKVSGIGGRILKQFFGQRGYRRVSVGNKNLYVHFLVAAAFIGPRPEGYEINHKDGNKENNSLDNLEYVTVSQNRDHARENHLHARGESCARSKLTEDQVIAIRRSSLMGKRNVEIAREYDLNRRTVVAIVARKTWRHI